MTLNLKPGELGSTGGRQMTPCLDAVVSGEISLAENDIDRMKQELDQTKTVRATVGARLERFRAAIRLLEAEFGELGQKEAAQKRILRQRRLDLVDLQAELE